MCDDERHAVWHWLALLAVDGAVTHAGRRRWRWDVGGGGGTSAVAVGGRERSADVGGGGGREGEERGECGGVGCNVILRV